eukprot:XP_017457274.1 PREDICTED: protocadherin-15-like [Rattus norvegicus]
MAFSSSTTESHEPAHVEGPLDNQANPARTFSFLPDEDDLSTHNPLYMESIGQRSTNSDLQPGTEFGELFVPRTQVKSQSLRGPREKIQRVWNQSVRFPRRLMWKTPNRPETIDLVEWQITRQRAECEKTRCHPSQQGSSNLMVTTEDARGSEKEGGHRDTLIVQQTEQLKSLSSGSSFSSSWSHFSFSTLPTISRAVELGSEPDVVTSPADCTLELSPPRRPRVLNSLGSKRETPTCASDTETKRNSFEMVPHPPSISAPLPQLPLPQPPIAFTTFPLPLSSPNPPRPQLLTFSLPISTTPASSLPPPPPPSLPPPPRPPAPRLFPLPPSTSVPSTDSISTPAAKCTASVTHARETMSTTQPPASNPPCGAEPHRHPKGILRHVKNLAELEKSVSNMYSHIEKNCPPTELSKLHPFCPAEKTNMKITCDQSQETLVRVVEGIDVQTHSQSTSL